MRSLRRLVVVAACALSLSGCTLVSTSSSPTLVNPNVVPLGLLDPTIPFTDFAQVHFVTPPTATNPRHIRRILLA